MKRIKRNWQWVLMVGLIIAISSFTFVKCMGEEKAPEQKSVDVAKPDKFEISKSAITTEVSIPATKDSYYDSSYPSNKYGSYTYLDVGYLSGDGNKDAIIGGFDLSPVPSSATINDAYLYVYAYGYYGSVKGIDVKRVGGSWSENTFCASNAPSIGSKIGSTNLGGNPPAWWAFDVKSEIVNNSWLTDSSKGQNGLYLIHTYTSGDNYIDFYSKDHGSSTPYLWIRYTCNCSSGTCCDGCNYRDSSYSCSTSTEYGCPWGTSCGADVGYRSVTQYCSGSSSSCNGSTSNGSWNVQALCSTSQTCSAGNPSCVTGSCGCACSAGACCDGCNYRSSSYSCSTSTEYGCPWGTSCGADVGYRSVTQYCSGSSSSCNGSTSNGSWNVQASCSTSQTCSAGNPSCVTGSCGCACSSGTCCDGCNYRSSSYKCQEDAYTEYSCTPERPKGKCGNDVMERHQDRYCSGSSASCNGAYLYDSLTLHQECSRHQVCNSLSHACRRKASCD